MTIKKKFLWKVQEWKNENENVSSHKLNCVDTPIHKTNMIEWDCGKYGCYQHKVYQTYNKQESAYAAKLIWVETDWFGWIWVVLGLSWMILVDYGWLWIILDDSGIKNLSDFLAVSGAWNDTFLAFLGPWNQEKPFWSFKGP